MDIEVTSATYRASGKEINCYQLIDDDDQSCKMKTHPPFAETEKN